MLYTDFIKKASDLTITQADNGLFYLEPMWRTILFDNRLNLRDVKEKIGWEDVKDVLKLEVERRNTVNSNKPYVLDWIYEVITSVVDPVMTDEENNLLKDMLKYRKQKAEGS